MIVYRYDDSGAPSGNVWTVLRACLVTGYGSKPAAGWSTPFSNATNDNWVFRQGSSSSGNVDDYVVDSNGLRGWDEATGYDTGNGPYCGTVPIVLDTTKWVVVADDRTAICLLWAGTFGFGDLDSGFKAIWSESSNNGCVQSTSAPLIYGPSPYFAWNGRTCAAPILLLYGTDVGGIVRGVSQYLETLAASGSYSHLIDYAGTVLKVSSGRVFVPRP